MDKRHNNILVNFIKWWLKGLAYLFPEKLRLFLIRPPDEIIIQSSKDQYSIKYIPYNCKIPITKRIFKVDNVLQKKQSLSWIKDLIKNKSVNLFYELDPKEVLHKTLHLPGATKNSIEQVLSFEIDRCTPFKLNDVYFDYIYDTKSNDKNEIQIELFVVKRNIVDTILSNNNEWGLKLDAVSIASKNKEKNTNFIPKEHRPNKKEYKNRLTVFLILICFFLGATHTYFPILQKQKSINSLNQELKRYKKESSIVQNLKVEKVKLVEKAEFLIKKHKETTPPIKILNELTKIIPEHTWVNRFILSNNKVQIQGESDNTSELIPLLETSSIFNNANFSSPTIINRASEKERYHITFFIGMIE